MQEKYITRFWKYVDRSGGPDACWPWTGSKHPKGYGQLMTFIDGKKILLRSHRIAYELRNAHDPGNLQVCHRCDNPSCCNPEHLFLGTGKENQDDCSQKGRRANAVSRETINAILAEYAAGNQTQRCIAKNHGVHYSYVSYVVHGKRR